MDSPRALQRSNGHGTFGQVQAYVHRFFRWLELPVDERPSSQPLYSRLAIQSHFVNRYGLILCSVRLKQCAQSQDFGLHCKVQRRISLKSHRGPLMKTFLSVGGGSEVRQHTSRTVCALARGGWARVRNSGPGRQQTCDCRPKGSPVLNSPQAFIYGVYLR